MTDRLRRRRRPLRGRPPGRRGRPAPGPADQDGHHQRRLLGPVRGRRRGPARAPGRGRARPGRPGPGPDGRNRRRRGPRPARPGDGPLVPALPGRRRPGRGHRRAPLPGRGGAARPPTTSPTSATPPSRVMARIRRVDCSGPGIRRRRRGRSFSYEEPTGEPVERPRGAGPHPGAGDPAGLEGRVDLPHPHRPPPGGRDRRRRPPPVPLPRGLADPARGGQVRPHAGVRPRPARAARAGGRAPGQPTA